MASTKVLLLEDIDNLGRKGDIVAVKPGYAFNFLLPKKHALIADANAIRRQARLQEERRLRAVEDKKHADELASVLNGMNIATEVKVDHEGHMYGSVSQLDIVHLIKAHGGMDIEKKNVVIDKPIKETGVFDIKLRLKEGVEAVVHLKIVAEAPKTA
jgi:large subunit ribosomal protein L9